jgi:hypothetical protein
MRSQRRPKRLVIGAAVLGFTMPTSAVLAARPVGPQVNDITGTEAGARFAEAAAERMGHAYAVDATADSLAVFELGGRRIAGPKGASLSVTEEELEDGTINLRFEASEPRGKDRVAGESLSAESVAALAAGSWTVVSSHCWIDDHNAFPGWMDVCYTKYRLSSDGDGSYDYFALNMYSTFATPGFAYEVGDPWIQSNPGSGAAHRWVDWDPGADTARACSTPISLSVAARGVGLTVNANQCETWDITKYATAGTFRNKWTEGFCMMRQGETQLEFEIVSKVAQGRTAAFTFSWNESHQPAACSW